MFLSRSLLSIALFTSLTLSQASAKPETYTIDSGHSSIQFKIKHFFSKVTGRFQKFEGRITVDRDALESTKAEGTIEAGSVDTNQAKRDEHLRKPDFFDVEKFPKISFVSKAWKVLTPETFEVTGDLTLHGVTKPVTLQVRSTGFGEGMKGAQLSGWEVRGTLKRSDFGMTTGTPAVGDDVEIEIEIEAGKS